ncbi:MAG TPA: hypothetical protein VIS49_08785 [Cyclobacteriaceae bacterium]
MANKCLVIMPTGDLEGYPQGHFSRVYEYVIAPACRSASLIPERIKDSMALSGDLSDAYRTLVESDVVVCDFSGQNQNVGYAFAMRKVLNLPVVIVKDLRTPTLPVTDEYGSVTYDESLRIDTVQAETNALTEAVNQATSKKGERHSILNSLMHQETQLSDTSDKDKKEKTLPVISPLPDYVGDQFTESEINKLKVGDSLFHLTRGRGTITTLKKSGSEKLAGINFESGSTFLVLGATEYFRKIIE